MTQDVSNHAGLWFACTDDNVCRMPLFQRVTAGEPDPQRVKTCSATGVEAVGPPVHIHGHGATPKPHRGGGQSVVPQAGVQGPLPGCSLRPHTGFNALLLPS